jgi:FAD/FMN-containing dehydrogenase
MTTFETFVDETLKHGLLPAVVPQLKTITVGGAVSGVGIESSSFKHGLVHETVRQMEIVTGNGDVVVCSREQNEDLFYGFPNSYGTLGYALRLEMELVPAPACVHLRHARFSESGSYFSQIRSLVWGGRCDFIDGTIFGPHEMYLTTGEFCDTAPRVSDYTYLGIYYKSIRRKQEDWLTAKDYIWRWDTDWFWCSKQFGVQNPIVRLLVGRRFLNSLTYQRIMRWAQRVGYQSAGTESVIQDVDIPMENAAEFLRFLLEEIGITPIWICPFRVFDDFDLYGLDPGRIYVNFGLWDVVKSIEEPGYYNRRVEQVMLQLCGKKGLYSSAYFDEGTFWRLYNGEAYRKLKSKHDPDQVFPDLYAKCVQNR